ncbi:hypothetical protein [Streptomyces sp. NPDC005805]|uniref:hypothetical protein n=1 Tax=Streptomyces sp. NPDC005805 TaxID=3157068 RepID=UPI0033C649AE
MPVQTETPQETEQKVAMVHAMMLVCFADKAMASQQIALVESYAKALPEFFGRDFQRYYRAAKELASGAGGSLDQAVREVERISCPELRLKTYCCCLELAHAGGPPGREEAGLLLDLETRLGIPAETVRTMREVVELKFSARAQEPALV